MEAKTFIVIKPHYYGKGASIVEAFANAKRAGYSYPRGKRKTASRIVVLSAEPAQVTIEADVSVRWQAPTGTISLQFDLEL